jgi:DNA polymerase V
MDGNQYVKTIKILLINLVICFKFHHMGFPSPAADYKEEIIDIGKELVQRPASTFFCRVSGDSMIYASMPDKALLVVDRSIKPKPGMIVVAVVDGEFTVRRLMKTNKSLCLQPENPAYKAIMITEEMNVQFWGVVTAIIIQPLKVS